MLSNIVTIGETLFDEHKKNLIIYCRSGQLIMNQFISIFSRFGFFLILLFFCSSHKIIQISCYSFIRNIKSHLGHSIFDYSFNVCWVFFVYDKKKVYSHKHTKFSSKFWILWHSKMVFDSLCIHWQNYPKSNDRLLLNTLVCFFFFLFPVVFCDFT